MASSRYRVIRSRFAERLEYCFSHVSLNLASTFRFTCSWSSKMPSDVLVERFTDPESRAGFSDAIFRTDVESKLRLAGIRMLTKEELSSTPGAPTLYLNVKPFHAQLGKSAYAISLALHQNARLEMNGERALGVCTWFTRSVGWGSLRDLRGDVRDDMDLFVNAWLAVNPGQRRPFSQ